MISRRALLASAAVSLAARHARAQAFPAKPIKVIVPFSPGGPGDVMARMAGQRMGAILGQNFVVENRPGAGGTIGARAAAQAEPDGYTLMLANTSTLVIAPAVYKSAGYDPLGAFAPIAGFGVTASIMAVNPGVPAKTVQEFIALAKAQPGKLGFASPGIGTPPHLIGELFKLRTGTDLVHVPYKGGGQSLGDVAGGQVQMVFENPSITLPLARAGKVRALASTGEARNPAAPELPTMIESGLADFITLSFTGLVAPAGTPSAITDRLNAAANESLNAPDMRALLARLAVEPRPGTPLDFANLVGEETVKWRAVIKAAKIRID